MDEFVTLFWSCVGIRATGLMTWLTSVLVSWLNSKIKDKQLAKWASDLSIIVINSVQAIMQTYVDGLKKEGKFGEAEAQEAKAKCLEIITNQLTTELKDYITDNFGDMQTYLGNQIEAVIYNLKR